MDISADGMIAQDNDDTTWISDEAWRSYIQTAQTAGNLVMGRRTYNMLSSRK